MKVVLGGTFDPVHVGHLRMALELAQVLSEFDPACRVDLMPCFLAVHKNGVGVSAEQRLAMLMLAVCDEPLLGIDAREIDRQRPSYTIDSLREMRAEAPALPVAWVIGSDNLASIHGWKEVTAYAGLCHLIVLERPGHPVTDAALQTLPGFRPVQSAQPMYQQESGCVLALQLSGLEVSSSVLRQCLEIGRSIRYLVPDAVLHHICDNALYRTSPGENRRPMQVEQMKQVVLNALEDLKADNIVVLDVSARTSVTDYMVIASGTSSRHVKSLADNVVSEVKENGGRPLGLEGGASNDWVLVDLGEIVVHVMMPATRTFYDLERFWRDGPDSIQSDKVAER